MAGQRKVHTAEFKLHAVKMITEQKFSVAEVARRLDVSESLLHTWKKTILQRGDDAFPGHLSPPEDELGFLSPVDYERAYNQKRRFLRDHFSCGRSPSS